MQRKDQNFESSGNDTNNSRPIQFVEEWKQVIEDTTGQLVDTFQNATREVSQSIQQEFSQKPWTFITAGVGGGIVLGYLLGKSRNKISRVPSARRQNIR